MNYYICQVISYVYQTSWRSVPTLLINLSHLTREMSKVTKCVLKKSLALILLAGSHFQNFTVGTSFTSRISLSHDNGEETLKLL